MEIKILLILLIVICVIELLNLIMKFKNKKTEDKIDEKKIDAIRKREEGFRNVMEYDYDVAIGRRVSGE